MRVLVIGATGYVGSRLIPELLQQGHTVRAGARDRARLERFWWHERVEPVEIDVSDAGSTRAAVGRDTDAVVYLVHGMDGDDFFEADHAAAVNVAGAATEGQVGRMVYLSGIIPEVPEAELSEHLRSRLDVERTLSAAPSVVVTLRAAMIFGGGSTSFELMRQLADRLPVTIVPDWMRHRVEPVAVSDVVRALVGALSADTETRYFDIGGGAPTLYPDLIAEYVGIAGRQRPQLTVGILPEKVVAQIAAWIADVPSPTVKALIESLQHDMVASDAEWRAALVADRFEPVGAAEAISRALMVDESVADERRDPLQRWSSDPTWAGSGG